MDCVFHAYCDHLRWLGLTPLPSEWLLYKTLKLASHGPKPQPTYGGVVPYIIGRLAARRGLGIAVEYRVWTPAHYEASAKNWVQRWFIGISNFDEEVECIRLSPAIYLALNQHHAFFSNPDFLGFLKRNNVTMAIQLLPPTFFTKKGVLQ